MAQGLVLGCGFGWSLVPFYVFRREIDRAPTTLQWRDAVIITPQKLSEEGRRERRRRIAPPASSTMMAVGWREIGRIEQHQHLSEGGGGRQQQQDAVSALFANQGENSGGGGGGRCQRITTTTINPVGGNSMREFLPDGGVDGAGSGFAAADIDSGGGGGSDGAGGVGKFLSDDIV